MTGGAGSLWRLETNPDGEVWAVLPYGGYQIRGENGGYAASFVVSPLRTTACELSRARGACTAGGSFFAWAPAYPVSYSLAGRLLHQEPGLITEPLDFSGLGSALLPWVSDRAISWTATLFRLQGMNATDSYQPGRPAILPDTQALADVIVQTGPDAGSTPAAAAEVGLFVTVGTGLWPVSTWHGEISADSTGSPLAANNLPAAGEGGYVLQPSGFNWYTRDHAAIGGPVTRWADLLLSATGQWDSQAAPLQPSGNNVNSRLLFGNAKGRIRTGRTSQLDAQFTGSRRDQSGWNLPAGVEALDGRRMAPPLVPLADLGETDHLDFVQAGWTRQIATSGLMELRYGYSTAHLDTRPNTSFGTDAQSRIEMNGGMVAGPPPLSNMAVRTRHQIEFAAEPGEFCLGAQRHRVVAGAGWQLAGVRNRFSAPSDLNLITADGSPASVLELNTPLDSRARIQSFSPYAQDGIAIKPWLTLNAGLRADFSRGSLPPQASSAGQFTPERHFTGTGDLISWNSLSPRFGLSLAPPFLARLTLRAGFSRLLYPLAGRYLDFGNPNSLGGLEYQWQDSNRDGLFQPNEQGILLRRFGGPYSGIDPKLKRPYADEIDLGAELSLPWRMLARLQLFRRDEKNRIAAVNTGVPPQAYQPRTILDPGPDFIPGTFDDQPLVVYEQDPATFGHDQFLLTNPPHLRMLNSGIQAGLGVHGRGLSVRASFLAEKSYGPTNPGNAVYENDSGVVGALFQDPNTLINAANRDYFDRAYVGKLEAGAVLPSVLGRLESGSMITYLDGLVFGRQLLVTGLAQGPFLVNATVRGSPEGGNRAQYVLDWDLRLSRAFKAGPGTLRIHGNVFNLLDGRNKTQEDAFSSPRFNQRLALAIQPARQFRFGVQYEF